MAYCKVKTRYLAEVSIEQFVRTFPNVYFYTFTEPGRKAEESYWTKTQAEDALKPFLELVHRRGGRRLVFWERQRRGSWHPHILLNIRFEVGWLREWMVDRGWGVQMRLRHVRRVHAGGDVSRDAQITVPALVSYLVKYLTKATTDDTVEPRKKFFGGSREAKAGTVQFKWCPQHGDPSSMLYYYGRELFVDLHGEAPRWSDTHYVIRLGVEATDWLTRDPWYMPHGP